MHATFQYPCFFCSWERGSGNPELSANRGALCVLPHCEYRRRWKLRP